MTRNEAIAKEMGWELVNAAYEFNGSKHSGYVDDVGILVAPKRFDPAKDLFYAKLLQSHMVDDGWSVEIWQHGDSPFPFKAKALSDNNVIRVYGKTEPAAIVELFCGVYGIPAGE